MNLSSYRGHLCSEENAKGYEKDQERQKSFCVIFRIKIYFFQFSSKNAKISWAGLMKPAPPSIKNQPESFAARDGSFGQSPFPFLSLLPTTPSSIVLLLPVVAFRSTYDMCTNKNQKPFLRSNFMVSRLVGLGCLWDL